MNLTVADLLGLTQKTSTSSACVIPDEPSPSERFGTLFPSVLWQSHQPTLSEHRIRPPGCSISINLTLWQPGPRRDCSGLIAAFESSDAWLSHDNCFARRAARAVVKPADE
jgi:hypothetical protein